jgi:hypothetical protein
VSVRFALQSLRKSISIWRAHHSNHTTISGHNNATFRKSYILPFLTFFFYSELYSFSFFCFWVLMYMYNMLLRFEKIYSAIYEHDMFTVNIYFFLRISRVLCFFKHFYGLNCIKVINFSSSYQIFSVGTKQSNDSNVNLYYTIRFPFFFSLTLFLFYFCN